MVEFVDYNGNDITDVIIQSNDNLLINSDFKSGIINQRGKNSYTGHYSNTVYTIDMWMIGAGSNEATLSVNSGYITLTSTATTPQWLGQSFNTLSGDFTLYVKVKSKTCNADVAVPGKTVTLNVGDNIINFSGTSVSDIWIRALSVGNIQIECVKLEKGNYFTGMPVYDKVSELEKCQSYYISIRNTNQGISIADTRARSANTAVVYISIPNFEITKGPTINIQNVFIVHYGDGVWRQVSKILSINYAIGKIIMEVETSVSTLNVQSPCYCYINTNGYINIDWNNY